MKNDDVALIRRVLAGDETAFAELVKKYQKPVHTLAWRKIGDFHIAEDITQETFLKVYQRLHTLKDPNQFSGWLYVITANLCATWLRKKRIQTQPLEGTEPTMIQEDAYSQHVTEERGRTAVEAQREVVKQLLAKLKESERTVMTLYYLGEMKVEEISRFLGVSASTIKSRLRRARNRLKEEEPMIREALEHFQITPNLTENIMREISRLKPIAPSGSKPLVPWAIGVSTLAVVLLMLGIGNQHLSRFQKPYSFDATSEMTVDIIEAPVVLAVEAKPDLRTQLGGATAPSKNDGAGQQPDDVLFAAAQPEEDDVSIPKQQWIQAQPVKGSDVKGLLATPDGEFYAAADLQIYKLEADGNRWQHLFDFTPLVRVLPSNIPIAKWKDTLYIVLGNKLFASKDDGKTWDLLHALPEDRHYYAIGLILTEQAFYAAFENGIFRSEDNGKTWQAINDGLMVEAIAYIRSIVNIQDTFFVGTSNGLYRLNANSWQRVEFPVSVERIRSAAATEDKLYVVAEMADTDPRKVSRGLQRAWSIFRSTDLGNSWTDITPTNAWHVKEWPPFIKLIATGDTLLAMEQGMVRSTDGGDTWLPVQLPGTSPAMNADVDIAIAVNERVFYVDGWEDGLHRSTDGGKSWAIVNITQDTGQIGNLIAHRENNKVDNMPLTLYTRYEGKVVQTTDRGTSWQEVQIEMPMTEPDREEPPRITHIVKADGKTYAKGGDVLGKGKTRIYRVSTDDNSLVPIQGMPILDGMPLRFEISRLRRDGANLSDASVIEQLREKSTGADEFFRQLAKWDPQQPDVYTQLGFRKGVFAVSGDTFYMEYNYKLLRWEPGDTEWYDTEQEETVELTPQLAFRELKLAASGNTVYVGKRDGHLVVSFDKGNNWIDLTPALPFSVKTFNAIISAGSTVYVATDAGIITSDDGRHWHIVTDAEGDNLIMEHLAVDETKVYGVSETGVYLLENGTWKQVVSEVPEGLTSLAVDRNVLYVGTQGSGMLHFNLDQ